MPYLRDITNDHEATRNEPQESKIQINMHINLISSEVQEKLVLFLCGVITKKLGWVMKKMTLLKNFLNLSSTITKKKR